MFCVVATCVQEEDPLELDSHKYEKLPDPPEEDPVRVILLPAHTVLLPDINTLLGAVHGCVDIFVNWLISPEEHPFAPIAETLTVLPPLLDHCTFTELEVELPMIVPPSTSQENVTPDCAGTLYVRVVLVYLGKGGCEIEVGVVGTGIKLKYK
jgi:hypothetical protein